MLIRYLERKWVDGTKLRYLIFPDKNYVLRIRMCSKYASEDMGS